MFPKQPEKLFTGSHEEKARGWAPAAPRYPHTLSCSTAPAPRGKSEAAEVTQAALRLSSAPQPACSPEATASGQRLGAGPSAWSGLSLQHQDVRVGSTWISFRSKHILKTILVNKGL